MSGRQWAELDEDQRAILVMIGALEAALTTVALVDLWRRPAGGVRGRKGWWAPAVFVQPLGPVAYLVFGRRRVGC